LLENCESRGHQRQTARMKRRGDARDHDARPALAPVDGWRHPHTSGEEIAETAEAAEANLHAHVGDRVVARRQKVLGPLNPGANAVLMRCLAEERLKLTDEMER